MYIHGAKNHPDPLIRKTYRIWKAMRTRVYGASGRDSYDEKGISLCPQWDDFTVFLADMGKCPSDKHSIERKDNDGHYEPSNCIWLLQNKQVRNQDRTQLNEQLALEIVGRFEHGESKESIKSRIGFRGAVDMVLRGESWVDIVGPITPRNNRLKTCGICREPGHDYRTCRLARST